MRLRRASLAVFGAMVLTGGALVGLSTGSADAGHTATSVASSTAGSVATVPEPVVTTVTQPTVATKDLPGTKRPMVVLGDMNTPEQFIIGQLYEVALEHEGYRIALTRNIGLPAYRTWALQHNNLSIYPEYLGEWNSTVAHLHRRFRTLRASYRAARRYAQRHGFVLLPPTPFSDTSCVAVQAQYAAANHISSITQLAAGDPVIFGAPTVFQAGSDGLPALERSYHLHPDYVQPIGDGGQYWWLRTGNVQAAYCATTDPALAGPKYVQLRDPRNVFGHGNVIPVTTRHVLQVEGPAFKRTIEKVDSLLTLSAIRGLNAESQEGNHDPTYVAEQFLEGNGVLPPVRYAPVPTTTSTTPTATGT